MRSSPPFSPVLLALLVACASPKDEPPPFESPGPGLIFTFPSNGQLDVPLGARVTVAFSEAIDGSALSAACSPSGTGGLCLLDGANLVAGTWAVVGDGGQAAEFQPDAKLLAGRDYALHISPDLLGSGVGNLPASGPALHFTTERPGNRVGLAATVIAINREPAAAYVAGSEIRPRLPLVDFSSFRLVFSEALDERSAVLGESVRFVEMATGAQVPGQLLVEGLHMTFDPDEDLRAGTTYELQITDALRDLGGEAVAAQSFSFEPLAAGQLSAQVVDVSPGLGDATFPEASSVSSLARNQVQVSTPLIGDAIVELRDGQVKLEMAQMNLFPDSVPVVIRKGQSLVASGLQVALAGTVSTGLDTGDLQLTFISDVTGYLVRNSHWPASVIPDNDESPLEVFLSFDIAVTAVDAVGNAVLTQNNLGVQASGIAKVQDGRLVITTLGSIELDLLGIARAPAQMALSLSTLDGLAVNADIEPPALRSVYPGAGEALPEPGDSILLIFSEAIELQGPAAVELRNEFGAAIEADVRATGSMVVITPGEPLADDVDYAAFINAGVRDLSGNSWLRQSGDPTAGEGVLRFHTARVSTADPLGPSVVAVYPGAPCALAGQDVGQRHCRGGENDDSDYLDFELPSNHEVEVLFDKPIRASSVRLGTVCGGGAIRVEQVTGTSCDAAVPGLVHVSERGIQFVPEEPWQEGASYRLRLIAGSNSTCSTGEICGANGLALNSDPLLGNLLAGGPDVELYFRAVPASTGEVAVTGAQPIVDRNGNGKVDVGESVSTRNRAAVRLADVGGIVSSASIDMVDCDSGTQATEGCMYMSSDLVVLLGEGLSDCQIPSASGIVSAANCIPATVSPGTIFGTELTMDANVLGLGIINDLKTGRVVLRVRESDTPVIGYIVEDAAGQPEILMMLSAYMDAPDLSILGGLASHDLHSKALEVSLRGPVEFREDGRLKISVSNEEAVLIEVNISAIGLSAGSMSLEIAPGAMALDLVSRPARGGQR